MFGGLVVWFMAQRFFSGRECDGGDCDMCASARHYGRIEFALVWGPRIAEERRRMVQ